MKATNGRSVGAQASTLLLTLVGGGLVGVGVASVAAPGSDLAVAVSVVVFPGSLAVGLGLWLGNALFLGLLRLLAFRLRGAGRPTDTSVSESFTPPGAFVFVPVSLAGSLVAGGVVAVASLQTSLLRTTGLYGAAGLLYGVVAWRLAERGYLRPPEGTL